MTTCLRMESTRVDSAEGAIILGMANPNFRFESLAPEDVT
jgi:hypothetical protein